MTTASKVRLLSRYSTPGDWQTTVEARCIAAEMRALRRSLRKLAEIVKGDREILFRSYRVPDTDVIRPASMRQLLKRYDAAVAEAEALLAKGKGGGQ